MVQRELKTKERTISTELSSKYKRRSRESLFLLRVGVFSLAASFLLAESMQRKIARLRFCHSVARTLWRFFELLCWRGAWVPWKYQFPSQRVAVSDGKFPSTRLSSTFLLTGTSSSHSARGFAIVPGLFNAVRNSHSYAVFSQVERVAHVIPCFLVGVTFPLDVRFPAVSSV